MGCVYIVKLITPAMSIPFRFDTMEEATDFAKKAFESYVYGASSEVCQFVIYREG